MCFLLAVVAVYLTFYRAQGAGDTAPNCPWSSTIPAVASPQPKLLLIRGNEISSCDKDGNMFIEEFVFEESGDLLRLY